MHTTQRLALHGGSPVRRRMLPYGHQQIDAADEAAVLAALRSEWLTTGPRVAEFERCFAETVGAREAVAVSSGTAALHAALHVLDLAPADEVIVAAMTFVASANAAAYVGARPVPADVDPATLLLDPAAVRRRLTRRTRAIVAVDYAGQPCDYAALGALAAEQGIPLVADAAHALGAAWCGRPVGSLARLTVFSFHPVKHITTGEGGMICTDDPRLAARLRQFRNHGIARDHRERETAGTWYYEMTELGFNYRLSDLQCALGLSQLRRLAAGVRRRQEIAAAYDAAFAGLAPVMPLARRAESSHAFHLYVVRLQLDLLRARRAELYGALRAEGIGVNVHYLPFHLHPYHRTRFGTAPGDCPAAEAAYEQILSLPIYPAMSDADVADVVTAVQKVVEEYAR
ncbi:MAG TPA: UDP-4-amino-4,6-dideoxy-N-acetyl-beta-L-altrosamine transaminase [Gemmatimonadaceae bacterium]|nr:UDP-4-amino-4,6-dideoxy-N-acetyl-beta-L-altrosamine transaminase [Gemmatimonadaceae bacterium]